MTKQKFRAATAIRHNGEDLAEGDTVELTDKEAAGLLESGAIVKIGAKAAGSDDVPTGTNPDAPRAQGGTDPAPMFSGAVAGPEGKDGRRK